MVQHARPRRRPLDARGAHRAQGRALRGPPQQGAADGLRRMSDTCRRRPTGRCSSTSCASWPQRTPTTPRLRRSRRRRARSRSASGTSGRTRSRAGSIDTRRRARATASSIYTAERLLPALDRRVRGRPQGRRGDGAGEHAAVGRRAGRRSSATPRSRAMFTCDGLLDHAHAVRDSVPSLRAIARPTADGDGARMGRRVDDARRERDPGAGRRRRHGRHHVHVGHDRLAEGRARPAPQRRDDAERRAALDRRAAGCTARRCSRSRA